MAGGKKKKKPVLNPARGFATTSIASKPKGDAIPEPTTISVELSELVDKEVPGAQINTASATSKQSEESLTAEDFERQLEESDLQVMVEKHAAKSKRDALRQKIRLETDRRVLRGQADNLSTRKWLSQELLEEIVDLIMFEGRYAGQTTEALTAPKQLSEEDLTIRLWTLEQALIGAGFDESKVALSLQHVLDMSDKVALGNKDVIWGIEESMDWLSRECLRNELPDYETWQRSIGSVPKSMTKTPLENPQASGTSTPRSEPDTRHVGTLTTKLRRIKRSSPTKNSTLPDYDSDIDPDDLLPLYLDCKTQLFKLQQLKGLEGSMDPKSTMLKRKAKKIEDDVLFDRYIADREWESRRILLEKDAAASRKAMTLRRDSSDSQSQDSQTLVDSEDEVGRAAAQIGAAVLDDTGSDDDAALADLFASLPVDEIDPSTGKSTTIINSTDGTKILIRDFGKWNGISPTRILEEACRARDAAVKLRFSSLSDSSYSVRYSLQIDWSKSQQIACEPPPEVTCISLPKSQTFKMVTISTPDAKQSEAFISTTALFVLFSSSAKEDKVFLRLPASWRDLWTELAAAKKDREDAVDRNQIRRFRSLIREKRDQEMEDGVLLQGAFKNRTTAKSRENKEDLGGDKSSRTTLLPEAYQNIWGEKCTTREYQMMLRSRMQLPMWGFREQVLESIDREQVVIICGETGCGKSTQVPSFILEHQLSQGKPCKIYCTEPRRISAISLARRVSEELGERKSDLGTSRSLVGYAIRLESNTAKETRLVYATTGIVMRMLEGSNDLKDITHIVLDEVHERTIDSDFLLIVLRKLMVKRRDLKVVLMSATVDAERFSKYLDGAPVLNVPGRTFPVEVKYLEDAIELTGFSLDHGNRERYTDLDDDADTSEAISGDSMNLKRHKDLRGYSNRTKTTIAQIDEYRIEFDLVTQLLAQIASNGDFVMYSKAILVFLPGIGEIRQLNDLLSGHPTFASNWLIYPLHSTIASEDQEAAFLIPPVGTRKIVLATNIAETGITIPDITCVIDTGKHREMRFDERRQLSRLLETFISKANAKQRRGRAGRVQQGLCFHLFTKSRHDDLMADQQTPEMLRLSLQDLAIRVKICNLGGIEETLGQALDPPLPKNIRRAIDALIDVRALTPGEDLTALGAQLARLPLDVFLGKLILMGSIFKCLDAVITIAATLSSKSPFSAPFGARAQADTVRLAFRRGDSDLLTVYNAYLAWKRVCISGGSEYQFCRKNYLSQQTLASIEELKGQLFICLVDAGFLPLTEAEKTALNKSRYSSKRRQFFELPQRANVNSDNDVVTASVIAWSFYPKLLVRDGRGFRNCANNQPISLHPSSVNKGHQELKWLSYYHIMQAKQFYNAHETTATEDFAIALLCGDVRCDMYAGVFILDGNRARFAVSDWKVMLVIKTLRARLRDILTRIFKSPGKPLTSQQQKWMDVWQKIYSQDLKER